MTNIFFTWYGGEGGDFIMSVLSGAAIQIDHTGRSLPVKELKDSTWGGFESKNITVYKCHRIWEEKSFIENKKQNSKILWLVCPDTDLLIKKRLAKLNATDQHLPQLGLEVKNLYDFNSSKKQMTRQQKLNYQQAYEYMLKGIKSYYTMVKLTCCNAVNDYKIIENNMSTFDEVVDAIEQSAHYIGIKFELNSTQSNVITNYLEKQNTNLQLFNDVFLR